MSLNSSKISIISATKVDAQKLGSVGDTTESLPAAALTKKREERRCNLCCVAYGSIISSAAVLCIAASVTTVSIYAEKRVRYSLNGAMRQVAWIALPGMLVGAGMHYFLSEAMWSQKRNSWGQAWAKAVLVNSAVWLSGIGAGTLFWRRVLPMTAAGRRLYFRFPVPTQPLELRVLRSSTEFFSGMGWTYWLSGVASGQLGLLTCVIFCVWNDRPYFMMSPHGKYAQSCMSPWRREQFAKMANIQYEEK